MFLPVPEEVRAVTPAEDEEPPRSGSVITWCLYMLYAVAIGLGPGSALNGTASATPLTPIRRRRGE